MFNPKNYQLRIQRYLVKIESQLKKKMGFDSDEDYSCLKFNNFFKSDIDANAFELQRYLEVLVETFPIKNPNRIFANISQQIANITAHSENEFNQSISRMHHFLKKAYRLVSPTEKKQLPDSFLNLVKNRYLPLISNAIKADKKNYLNSIQLLGKDKPLDISKISTLSDLLDAASSQTIRQNLQQAFNQILTHFNLKIPGTNNREIFDFFHIIEIPARRQILSNCLEDCFLIPLTENLTATDTIKELSPFFSGKLVGSTFFNPVLNDQKGDIDLWHLTCLDQPEALKYGKSGFVLLFKLSPKQGHNDISSNDTHALTLQTQWIIDQTLLQIHELYQNCTRFYQKLLKMIEAEYLERQVQEFEQDSKPMEIYKYGLLLDAVQDLTGIKLPFKTTISPTAFSKQLYNAIVAKTNQENPDLKLEERGNKAYTLWRYMLSRIVAELPAQKTLGKDQLANPVRILVELKNQLFGILSNYKISADKNLISIGESKSDIHLKKILELAKHSEKSSDNLLVEITRLLEIHHRKIYEEFDILKKRTEEIGKSGKKLNAEDLRVSYINSIISKLQKILLKTSF